MQNLLLIQKALPVGLKPMHWQKGSCSVILMCPNGHIGSLFNHTISDDGSVFPSVQCMEAGCTFHAYIKLKDWKE